MPTRVYQVKISLAGIDPPIWRQILVSEVTTLSMLHRILQAAFGWEESHLHEFRIDDATYGDDEDEDAEPPPKPERRARLNKVAKVGTTFEYLYDFGDNWRHTVLIEALQVAEPGAVYPACIAGARACPPEDSGGAGNYADFVAAIANPAHPDHDWLLDWAGGSFDPEAFDVGDVNSRLRAARLVK